MFGKHKQRTTWLWLWLWVVMLFPAAATLMPPVIQGLCVGIHAGCPAPSTLELYSADHDAPAVVGQGSCCASAPHILRSRSCHCDSGDRVVAGNITVTLSASGKRDVPLMEPEWCWYQVRGSGNIFQVSFPRRFSSPPVSLALTVVQATVLLI